jgi:hypothetical protein
LQFGFGPEGVDEGVEEDGEGSDQEGEAESRPNESFEVGENEAEAWIV